MLYLWPYIAFFSLPILLPYLLQIALPQKCLPRPLRSSTTSLQRPKIMTALFTMFIMMAIVHYNTIVHPFTLADNRHYTFYVFRILLRHPSLRYLAIPVYYLCAWAVFAALGAPALPTLNMNREKESNNRSAGKPMLKNAVNDQCSTRPCTFWLLIWLATTAMSLCTAPLVEPRYCIIPWIIWRLHISTRDRYRLWLETLWFLVINASTCYIFLFWGFSWPQEPDKVQRFMW